MKYKKVQLKDIADIVMGQSPKSQFYNTDGKGIPFLQGVRTFGENYPIIDTYTTSFNREANVGEILFSVRAPVGRVNWATKRIAIGRGLAAIRVKERYSPNYLYYLFKKIGEHLDSLATGTVFTSINKKELSELSIDIPASVVDQERVANYLKKIDLKIEKNNQINDNLTNQLHTISDNYFSYFNFNDGSIPQNWTYKNLTDIAEITSGYSYKGKELVDSDLGMATIKNFARTGGFQINGYKSIIPSKNVKQSQYASLFDMLIAHTDLTQNADIIGNAEPVLTTSRFKKIIYSMDLVKVIPKQNKISKWLLDLILMSTRVKAHCLGYVNGTTVLHLSKKALKEFEIPLPNDPEELSGITRIARNYLLMMSENMQENEKLIELKDQLLNKYF